MNNKRYGEDNKEAFHILICLIQIWDKSDGFMTPPPNNTLEIAEVENIEISDNYRQLINKATVRFPRGTVIRKTYKTIEESLNESDKVTASLDDRGVLLNTHTIKSKIASVADFAVGKRIRIYLGYTTDPKIAEMPKYKGKGKKTIYTDQDLHDKYFHALTHTPFYAGPMFDGYISKCSIDTPIEIECEDLASVLKQFNAPNIPQHANLTVNDLLAEDGKWKMLKDTGFKLYPETKSCTIDIGPIALNSDLTIADVLTTWTKYHLYSYVWVDYKPSEPIPYIVVGRSYFTNSGKDSVLTQRQDHGYQYDYKINFNYHVANNGLTLMETNKDYLCIQGTCMDKTGDTFSMTVRKNPEWKEGDSEKSKWQILHESTLTKKQKRMGMTAMSQGDNKNVDLSRYDIRPYMSRKIGVSRDDFLQELIEYYESYHMNGIDGTLTLFGDLQLVSGVKVHLTDPYYPAKNGTYFVEEVSTKFGNDGFRQTIKLPYCIKRDEEQ